MLAWVLIFGLLSVVIPIWAIVDIIIDPTISRGISVMIAVYVVAVTAAAIGWDVMGGGMGVSFNINTNTDRSDQTKSDTEQ
jgi:hypothetical protein